MTLIEMELGLTSPIPLELKNGYRDLLLNDEVCMVYEDKFPDNRVAI